MKKINFQNALANFADCKIAFANDCANFAPVATENVVKNISSDDDCNIHPLYIGNCNLNKKSVLNACKSLAISNVNVCSTNTKKHYLTITFDNCTMYFTPVNYTINANDDNAQSLAQSLANMFYHTK